jgi:hypothetical protein
MTQASRACGNPSRTRFGEAGSRLWRPSVERCARVSTAFHRKLFLAALPFLAACGSSQHPSPTRNVSTGTTAVADFAGTAEAIAPASSCPQILSPGLRNPFSAGPPLTSPADYRLVGCWHGTPFRASGLLLVFLRLLSPQSILTFAQKRRGKTVTCGMSVEAAIWSRRWDWNTSMC